MPGSVFRSSRRAFLAATLASLESGNAAASPPKLRVGIMDVILGYPSKPEAFEVAGRIGFDGIQISLGKPTDGEHLLLSDPGLQQRILDASRSRNVAITSTYLEIMHRDCLQSVPAAKTWVREAIKITKALNGGIVELAFFFKCGLKNPTDVDGLVAALKDLAPATEEAGVLLGVEDTLSAEENVRILDRVGSPAVKNWYDVGNSTNMGHFDVPHEIRYLGKDRIGQIHIKDKVYLGQGAVDVKGCLRAIADIGYTGFCVLETAAPTGDKVADAQKNLQILRDMQKQLS